MAELKKFTLQEVANRQGLYTLASYNETKPTLFVYVSNGKSEIIRFMYSNKKFINFIVLDKTKISNDSSEFVIFSGKLTLTNNLSS